MVTLALDDDDGDGVGAEGKDDDGLETNGAGGGSIC